MRFTRMRRTQHCPQHGTLTRGHMKEKKTKSKERINWRVDCLKFRLLSWFYNHTTILLCCYFHMTSKPHK
ncbi:hypothetical protein BLOT_004596 [Blomia tropicalis]|nr:hypothetical protein BLOT_004596 [Blomia tropicalis]